MFSPLLVHMIAYKLSLVNIKFISKSFLTQAAKKVILFWEPRLPLCDSQVLDIRFFYIIRHLFRFYLLRFPGWSDRLVVKTRYYRRFSQ